MQGRGSGGRGAKGDDALNGRHLVAFGADFRVRDEQGIQTRRRTLHGANDEEVGVREGGPTLAAEAAAGCVDEVFVRVEGNGGVRRCRDTGRRIPVAARIQGSYDDDQ